MPRPADTIVTRWHTRPAPAKEAGRAFFRIPTRLPAAPRRGPHHALYNSVDPNVGMLPRWSVRAFQKIRISVLLAASAAACTGRPDPATVRIDARPLSREAARTESLAAVESGHGAIAVRRTLRVSDPCRRVAAGVVRTGGQLTLRVVAEPDGRRCRAAEAYVAYTARIEALPPGRYDLRVVHADRGGRGRRGILPEHPVLVMERSVEVP